MAGEQKRSLDRYRAKRSRSLMELAVLQRPPPTFSSVFSIGPCSEALFESFTCKQLRKLQQALSLKLAQTQARRQKR